MLWMFIPRFLEGQLGNGTNGATGHPNGYVMLHEYVDILDGKHMEKTCFQFDNEFSLKQSIEVIIQDWCS